MGIAVPITLFFLLGLANINQLLSIAAVTFLAWCFADFLATILSKPRLSGRSPQGAFKEDWERRSKE